MREILFRGKRIGNGEWVEGWYQPPVEWGGHTFGTAIAYICSEGWLDDVVVDPATVGQYTGLQDKNGKRIFEGDICRICRAPEICTAVVEYKEDIASFIWRCNENEMLLPVDFCVARNKVGDDVWVEVIGNIHDNPELMEVQR